MQFKKIQEEQINIDSSSSLGGRIAIFMTDVNNLDNSNTIIKNYIEAVGDVKPLSSFSTNKTLVKIKLEWEAPNDSWNGFIKINGNLVEQSDSLANFELLEGRRFSCEYVLDITELIEINFSVHNNELLQIAYNKIDINEYVEPEIVNISYIYGTHTEQGSNILGDGYYPVNTFSYLSTIDPIIRNDEDVEQKALKQGDWVKINFSSNDPIQSFKLRTTQSGMFGVSDGSGGIIPITSDGVLFELDPIDYTNSIDLFLKVIYNGNIDNVAYILQISNGSSWSQEVTSNNANANIAMEGVVNINNTVPVCEMIPIINDINALKQNDEIEIQYNSALNTYFKYNTLSSLNSIFGPVGPVDPFKMNAQISSTLELYDLTHTIYTDVINWENGIETRIESNIPIASIQASGVWSILKLKSSGSGNDNVVKFTANQILDTSISPNILINSTPDSLITINSITYNDKVNYTEIEFNINVKDSYNKGIINLSINNITNLAGIVTEQGLPVGVIKTKDYSVSGFVARVASALSIGAENINIGYNMFGDVDSDFVSILQNNGSSMNYKSWDNGDVLNTDSMTKITGLAPSDQYAYTYNPNTKEVIISNYILATLLNNIATINIQKN